MVQRLLTWRNNAKTTASFHWLKGNKGYLTIIKWQRVISCGYVIQAILVTANQNSPPKQKMTPKVETNPVKHNPSKFKQKAKVTNVIGPQQNYLLYCALKFPTQLKQTNIFSTIFLGLGSFYFVQGIIFTDFSCIDYFSPCDVQVSSYCLK